MFHDHHFHRYTITKMPKRQRSVMLAAIDAGGRLPIGLAPAHVVKAIPEAWARVDDATGTRYLTPEGRAALISLDRFRHLRLANPETGAVYGLNYRDCQGLHRDGLVIFQSRDGRIAQPTDQWMTDAFPYITERGRKLVGMPLTAPPFAVRMPLRSRAVWRRAGQPDEIVAIRSWPFTDGTVLVSMVRPNRMVFLETQAPATELYPR